MDIGWKDIAFVPGMALGAGIVDAWVSLTGRRDVQPFLCSMLGDVFMTDPEGAVHWLCCPGGHFDQIASSRAEFDQICEDRSTHLSEWFGPPLIEKLHRAGKIARPGEAYMFTTLPIFPECSYSPENITVKLVDDVFIGLAEVMQLYEGLPDRQKRRLHLFE